MARINADSIWWADPRRMALVQKIGCYLMADGVALNMWRLGQESELKDMLVSEKQFNLIKYHECFIECELAEIKPDGIYIKGSKSRCGFLKQQAEKGRKSALKRKLKYGTAVPFDAPYNGIKSRPNRKSNQVEPIEPSSSSSSSKKELNTLAPFVAEKESPLLMTQQIMVVIESAYVLYPRKKGKIAGIKKAMAQIKSISDAELFKKAVINYTAEIEANKTEPNFVKYFSSFVSDWRDWIEITIEPKQQKINKATLALIEMAGEDV